MHAYKMYACKRCTPMRCTSMSHPANVYLEIGLIFTPPKISHTGCHSVGWHAVGMLWCPRMIPDRKSTRLNSSHVRISYAVFCLKKKKEKPHYQNLQNTYIYPRNILNYRTIPHSTNITT